MRNALKTALTQTSPASSPLRPHPFNLQHLPAAAGGGTRDLALREQLEASLNSSRKMATVSAFNREDYEPARGSLPACAVLCGVGAIAEVAMRKLERDGFRIDPDASLALVLDAPPGFALHTLETMRPSSRRLIVITPNRCIEYCDDLWDLQATALLAGQHLDLKATLQRVVRGERYRDAPHAASPLTRAERRALRLLARGWSNQQIAAELSLQYQSVLNVLRSIYRKLGLANRNEAALYYWGVWHALDRPHAGTASARTGG
jgi:DNA-binding NarL/FixJ family response regulator